MAATIAGLVTVRSSSSRLPGKCLLPFGKGNVLQHVIRRARAFGVEPIVCTSTDSSDDVIEKIAVEEKTRCYRGSLLNKLKRWSDCAEHFGLDCFHTVDADDPFFDGDEIRFSMALLLEKNLDMVCPSVASSSGAASVGFSLTTDVVKRATANLADEADTEMMWYYIEKIQRLKSIVLPDSKLSHSRVRLTLDYQEDYWLLESVRRMVGNLAPRREVDELFVRNPDLYKINWFRNGEWKNAQISKRV